MAKIIYLNKNTDQRGSLTSVQDEINFKIQRVYYLYNLSKYHRGGHRHKKTKQALISLNGSCSVFCSNGHTKKNFILNKPNKCLILEPEDWHTLSKFKKNTIILVLASHKYDTKDYIIEPYK